MEMSGSSLGQSNVVEEMESFQWEVVLAGFSNYDSPLKEGRVPMGMASCSMLTGDGR